MPKYLALVAIAAALMTGCASVTAESPTTKADAQTDLGASRVKDYASIAELRAESTAVIRATVESSTVEDMNGLPFTISKVQVRKALWGNVPSETLAVRQVGDSSMRLHDTGAILSHGREYVLFIKPFHLTPGDNTGQYLITGDQGYFVLDAKGERFEFAGAGDPPNLPKSLSVKEIDSGTFLN